MTISVPHPSTMSANSMDLRRGKRQILFSLTVILPAAVLVGLAARVFRQETELAANREAEQRREALEQVRREVATRLEAIKLEEVNRLRDDSSQFMLRHPPDSPVVFILPIEQDRIVMPWQDRHSLSHASPQYLMLRRNAEAAEFQLNRSEERRVGKKWR